MRETKKARHNVYSKCCHIDIFPCKCSCLQAKISKGRRVEKRGEHFQAPWQNHTQIRLSLEQQFAILCQSQKVAPLKCWDSGKCQKVGVVLPAHDCHGPFVNPSLGQLIYSMLLFDTKTLLQSVWLPISNASREWKRSQMGDCVSCVTLLTLHVNCTGDQSEKQKEKLKLKKTRVTYQGGWGSEGIWRYCRQGVKHIPLTYWTHIHTYVHIYNTSRMQTNTQVTRTRYGLNEVPKVSPIRAVLIITIPLITGTDHSSEIQRLNGI